MQNDWFGLPSQEKDELYNWSDAFTWLLEGVLHEAQDIGIPLRYEDVRRYLSRAIGSFLFDDCEVPSLVSFTGDEEAIVVEFDIEDPSSEDNIPIKSVISVSHALWGDPMLESEFIDPSAAFLEGYGGTPFIFTRQKTKRLWYTLFLALIIVIQSQKGPLPLLQGEESEDKVLWAKQTLGSCVESLKDAPCY